jgi:hypothetical protein
VDHPGSGAARDRTRELEEREDRAGRPALIAVVEVVDVRGVEVHGLLDHTQPQQPGVEVDVPWRIGRDAGDVVDAVKLHLFSWLR